MSKGKFFLIFPALIFCFSSVQAEETVEDRRLFSPSVAQKFHEIAYETSNDEKAEQSQIRQAYILLRAAVELDSRTKYVLPEMINIATMSSKDDYSEMVNEMLLAYVDESSDLEVAEKAIRYLLERLNFREQREMIISQLLIAISKKNKTLTSELNVLLGLLAAERSDTKAATDYFMEAYVANKYNKLAFEKLSELIGEQIGPAMILEHLRMVLGKNPLNIESALIYVRYAEKQQLYDVAADGYEYCANLFGYLYPSQPLPASIYLPWAMSCYNTLRSQYKCLQIAKIVRQSGNYDILLEAVAGRAARKTGNNKQADEIFGTIEQKAGQLLEAASAVPDDRFAQVAWIYCFASPDKEKALAWANKAYSLDPNSANTAAILAYSLMMNGQREWAKPLVGGYQENQISAIVSAQIQHAEDKKDSAIETLKSAIAMDAASLEAERAKQLLADWGGNYAAGSDPDIILTTLRNNFRQSIVPKFVAAEKIISVQMNLRGSKFSYDRDFGAVISIANNSSEPLVISDEGLFTGRIRVDANVTGDIKKQIPNLVSIKIHPSAPIAPGKSILVPLRLVTGEFRELLLFHPQASLDIEFTVYLDPIPDGSGDDGKVKPRLAGTKPVKISVKRSGIQLSGKYLQNRLHSLPKGKQGQKNQTTQLFVGLLLEQNAMANREPLYKFMYADWMPDLLKSAIKYSLVDDDWLVKVHTMASLLALPLDYELIDAVSGNLNDTHWPARLMAIYLLARDGSGNIGKVLDWTARYDSNELVRDMAVALGGKEPPPEQLEDKSDSLSPQADPNTP